MKRTKEHFRKCQPNDRSTISNVQTLDGEDNNFLERKKQQAFEKEIQMIKEMEKEEEKLFAYQNEKQNRIRGLLENETNCQKRIMAEAMKDANLQLAMDKRAHEREERERKIREEREMMDLAKELRKVK